MAEASSPDCPHCGGTGEYFGHADDCQHDSCALAGGIDDCSGQVLKCGCAERRSRLEDPLVAFFNTPDGYRHFGHRGDHEHWQPAQTAVHFLGEYAAELTRREGFDLLDRLQAVLAALRGASKSAAILEASEDDALLGAIIERVRQEERAAIVNWLMTHQFGDDALDDASITLANYIDHADHLKPAPVPA